MTGEPTTLRGVVWWVLRDPWDALGRRWNYKSAVMSSLFRGQLFFFANLTAGLPAAVAALVTECWLRFLTAGSYGALTQAFRCVQPPRAGMIGALVIVPATAHTLEVLVHWWSGTQELGRSVAVSVFFTMVSTSFNLFAMRHGALTVGADSQSLLDDLRAVPRLICAFAGSTVRTLLASR